MASRPRHAPLERAQNAHEIGVVAIEFSAAADDNGIYGADFDGQRVAIVEVAQDGVFVRNRHTEARNPDLSKALQKIRQDLHPEGEIDSVEPSCLKTRVVQQW